MNSKRSRVVIISAVILLSILNTYPALCDDSVKYGGRVYSKERFKNLVKIKDLVEHEGKWMTRHEKLGSDLKDDPGLFALSDVIKYAAPAVASIMVDDGRQGSGTVINSNGLIVTNWHVVKGADSISVRLHNDNTQYAARVFTQNEDYDIALISMGGTDHPYIRIADSEDIAVGDPVTAMGSPFGLSATATTGIISSIRRLREYPDVNSAKVKRAQGEIVFIQTDAAINPGNSGGPLLNNKGEVIGINSFGISKEVAEGLNFALHASELKKLYPYHFK